MTKHVVSIRDIDSLLLTSHPVVYRRQCYAWCIMMSFWFGLVSLAEGCVCVSEERICRRWCERRLLMLWEFTWAQDRRIHTQVTHTHPEVTHTCTQVTHTHVISLSLQSQWRTSEWAEFTLKTPSRRCDRLCPRRWGTFITSAWSSDDWLAAVFPEALSKSSVTVIF